MKRSYVIEDYAMSINSKILEKEEEGFEVVQMIRTNMHPSGSARVAILMQKEA